MADTLEKIRRLEQYVADNNASVDPVLDQTLDKLLMREITNMSALQSRLKDQIASFEKTYNMKSEAFYAQYSTGTLGDKMDFIEWASTIDMLTNTEKRLAVLEQGSDM